MNGAVSATVINPSVMTVYAIGASRASVKASLASHMAVRRHPGPGERNVQPSVVSPYAWPCLRRQTGPDRQQQAGNRLLPCRRGIDGGGDVARRLQPPCDRSGQAVGV